MSSLVEQLENRYKPGVKRTLWTICRDLFALLGVSLVVACNQTISQVAVATYPSTALSKISNPNPTETPVLAPTLAETHSPTPILTQTPTLTQTATPTPECFHLLNPPHGAQLPEVGRVKFEWEPDARAQKYLLELTAPDGHMLAFETFNTSVERYLNTLPWGGVYAWRVAAMNAEGGVLCIVGPLEFSKPQYKPSLTPETNPPPPNPKNKKNQGGG